MCFGALALEAHCGASVLSDVGAMFEDLGLMFVTVSGCVENCKHGPKINELILTINVKILLKLIIILSELMKILDYCIGL